MPEDRVSERGAQRGAAYVEATIVIPLLVLFLVAGIELMLLAYRATMLQMTVTQIVRPLNLGQCAAAPCTAATRETYIRDLLIQRAGVYGITVATSNICIHKFGSACSFGTIQPGNPGDMMVVEVQAGLHPGFHFPLTNLRAMAVGQNERFDRL